MRLAAALALALSACATAKPPPWVPAEASFTAADAGFEVSVPAGWMRRNPGKPGSLLITRDGTPLQRIIVDATEFGKPLGLGESKRVVTAGMSPQELAEVAIDDLTSGTARDVRILENAPATVGGRPGFRIVAAVPAGGGPARKAALYGVSSEARFYLLLYVAPERHYFARDLPTFEELARSFRLKAPAPPSA